MLRSYLHNGRATRLAKFPVSVAALIIGTASLTLAQTHHQTLYWLRYQTLTTLSERLTWNNDIDNRRFFNPDVQNQMIFHSRLHYRLGKWDLAGGITWSVAYASIPEDGYKHPVDELRPVIEASYEKMLGTVLVSNRLRMDNRIFQESEEHSLFTESDYVMRLRYRLQGRFTLRKNSDGIQTVTLRIADEVMLNTRQNLFDQNRFYLTGEFYINKRFSFAPEYIYIYQQRFGMDEIFSRNVFRFTLHHRVNAIASSKH